MFPPGSVLGMKKNVWPVVFLEIKWTIPYPCKQAPRPCIEILVLWAARVPTFFIFHSTHYYSIVTVLLTENDRRAELLIYTTVHSLMMGLWGSKHVEVGVSKHYSRNEVCACVDHTVTICTNVKEGVATAIFFHYPDDEENKFFSNFFIIKPTRCTNFPNLYCHETLHVSDSSSVHHQEFIHCTLSNGICHTGM